MNNGFYIMSADTVTAKWENGILYVQDEARPPLFLKRLRDADRWLETRAIDSHIVPIRGC